MPYLSTQSWCHALLDAPIDPTFKEGLTRFLQDTGRQFLSETPQYPTEPAVKEANRWYASKEGQETLEAVVSQAWAQMSRYAAHAMPAHDARHAMHKVPITALEYVMAENVQGYERVGVLGALLHDHGRWAEERIYGGPGPGMRHARLSFLLAQELLARFELPDVIREQILIAVVRHTSGAVAADPMPLKLTVAADRDQLYGPEIVIRLFHHGQGEDGSFSAIFDNGEGSSVLDRLEHLSRNRLAGPLYAMPMHLAWLQSVLRTFILMAEDADASRVRFAVDVSQQSIRQKRPMGEVGEGLLFNWESEWTKADAVRPRVTNVEYQLKTLFSAPNLAANSEYTKVSLSRLTSLTERQAERLAGALAWAHEARVLNDTRQQAALVQVLTRYQEDRMLTRLAMLLLA
jgi:hypothetical protein